MLRDASAKVYLPECLSSGQMLLGRGQTPSVLVKYVNMYYSEDC